MRSVVVSLLVAAGASGCAVGPNFHRPPSWWPGAWFSRPGRIAAAERSLPVAEPINPAWWKLFGDPELILLEDRITGANLDVAIATARLAESRSERGIAAAGLFPSLKASGSYARSKESPKGVYGLLTGAQSGRPSGNSVFPPIDVWQDGFDASWQLDIWGKVRRQVESADASYEASADDRRNVLLMSLAETARDYIQLRGVQSLLAITRDNVDIAQRGLDLTRSRLGQGVATNLDFNNAAAQVESTAAELPQLLDQQEQLINALSLLLGDTPGCLRVELADPRPVPPVPPAVPVGLPSELARRRPDIRQAEATLHAATAEIGAAQADFYPSLTLTGSFGFQALNLRTLGNWAARTWMAGPALELPIFQGGRLTATLHLRKAQQQEAAIQYRKTVLQAWHEIANALSSYGAEQTKRDHLARNLVFNRNALTLARQRYVEGVADFLDVLDAEGSVLSSERQLSDSTTQVSTNLVVLYKALGGGWETSFPDPNDVLMSQERRSPYGTIVLPEGR